MINGVANKIDKQCNEHFIHTYTRELTKAPVHLKGRYRNQQQLNMRIPI